MYGFRHKVFSTVTANMIMLVSILQKSYQTKLYSASNGSREHMAGDVPGRSGKGQYGKRQKYEGCD